ncbi:hypothetical protein MKX03_035456 [Papaver bracteatum]|nr:hypothetical protein MKX03_035456 [Papaver bracteatum]
MVFSSPLGLGLRQLAYRRYRQRRRRSKRVQAACNTNPVGLSTSMMRYAQVKLMLLNDAKSLRSFFIKNQAIMHLPSRYLH